MVSKAQRGNGTSNNNNKAGSQLPDSSYIPSSYLPNLKKYRYSGADFSIMSRYVMQSYWNFIVSLVPMTVAPNMITFTGFIIGMSSSFVLLYFYFMNEAVYPSWAWYYACFSLFSYQTLDAIDGKQARRTGTGSPLGELFDHGCDAFLTPYVQMNIALAINAPSWMLFGYVFLSSMGLFTAIYEQYCTGTLDLGYLSGPTEGILLACLFFIMRGMFGSAVFDQSVVGPYSIQVPTAITSLLTKSPVFIVLESFRSCVFTFFVVSWCITVAANLLHVAIRPSVHRSPLASWLASVPMAMLFVLHVLLFVSYTDVHEQYPFVFELSLGGLVSTTVTRLTISRLCMSPYSPFTYLYMANFAVTATALAVRYGMVPGVGVDVVSAYLGPAMLALTLLGVAQYGHMVMHVFRQLAAFLNIRIMSIKSTKEE